MWAAILTFCGAMTLTSCSDDDETDVNPEEPVVLNCEKPDYLKVGDRVALVSPSYYPDGECGEDCRCIALVGA